MQSALGLPAMQIRAAMADPRSRRRHRGWHAATVKRFVTLCAALNLAGCGTADRGPGVREPRVVGALPAIELTASVDTQELAACGVRAKARVYAVGTRVSFRGRTPDGETKTMLTVLRCSGGRFVPVRRLSVGTSTDGAFHGSFDVRFVSECYIELRNGPRAYFVVRQLGSRKG